MLPKHSRLTKETIERYLIRARRIQTSRFLVMYAHAQGSKRPQIGFTVSKKIAPKAVLRNRLRRRGYDAMRASIHMISPGAVVLVSYRSPVTDVPLAEITDELEQAFKQAGLFQKK